MEEAKKYIAVIESVRKRFKERSLVDVYASRRSAERVLVFKDGSVLYIAASGKEETYPNVARLFSMNLLSISIAKRLVRACVYKQPTNLRDELPFVYRGWRFTKNGYATKATKICSDDRDIVSFTDAKVKLDDKTTVRLSTGSLSVEQSS